jgi:hypothetical protein
MRVLSISIALLFLSCASPDTPTKKPHEASPAQPSPVLMSQYPTHLKTLQKKREALQQRYKNATKAEKGDALAEAKAALFTSLREEIFPAWFGTQWDYSGTTQTPGEGKIACGYFVSTTLRDAGLKVERIKMAQQASENIVRTLTPETNIWRFRKTGVVPVLERVRTQGDGLYVVGLDNHVGYLSNVSGEVSFCHSSYLAPSVVVCEPAESAEALRSNYYVVGELLTEQLLLKWLYQEKFVTEGT